MSSEPSPAPSLQSENQSSQNSSTPLVSSVANDLRNLNNQIRAKIVSDAIKKGTIGALTGAAFSFLILRRKLAPVWLGLGLGLGMAYSDGSQLIRNAHDSVLEAALIRYDSEANLKDKKEKDGHEIIKPQ